MTSPLCRTRASLNAWPDVVRADVSLEVLCAVNATLTPKQVFFDASPFRPFCNGSPYMPLQFIIAEMWHSASTTPQQPRRISRVPSHAENMRYPSYSA